MADTNITASLATVLTFTAPEAPEFPLAIYMLLADEEHGDSHFSIVTAQQPQSVLMRFPISFLNTLADLLNQAAASADKPEDEAVASILNENQQDGSENS